MAGGGGRKISMLNLVCFYLKTIVGSILHGGPIELFLVLVTGVTKAVVCVILSVG